MSAAVRRFRTIMRGRGTAICVFGFVTGWGRGASTGFCCGGGVFGG
ncbi:hypothetical protein [Streptomyces sp. NPDC058701]